MTHSLEENQNLEEAFREAQERDEDRRRRLQRGEGVTCSRCNKRVLPEDIMYSICTRCGMLEMFERGERFLRDKNER